MPDSYPMAVTLNKDGKPRKVGSGKTKGAGCFEKISWSALKGYVGEEVEMPISRVWLRSIGASVEVKRAVLGGDRNATQSFLVSAMLITALTSRIF